MWREWKVCWTRQNIITEQLGDVMESY
jgi:hypothetical protein